MNTLALYVIFIFLLCATFFCKAQTSDLEVSRLYKEIVEPFNKNADALLNIADEYEKRKEYLDFKNLFESEKISIPINFDSNDHWGIQNPSPNPGIYIQQLWVHWKKSGKFIIPKLNECRFGYKDNLYVILFESVIAGNPKLDTTTIEYSCNEFIEIRVNMRFKIQSIKIIEGLQDINQIKDSDKDQIIDIYENRKYDECPEQKGLLRFFGCPDSDLDGIPDKSDQCPDEHQGDNGIDGCPDDDKDGVINKKDQCPNTKGAEVTKNGCDKSAKPNLIHFGIQYNPVLPMAKFADTNPLTEPSFDWANQVGFANPSWNPLNNNGLFIDIMPTRWVGLGLQGNIWNIPINSSALNRQMDIFFSRRVRNFEDAIVSSLAYRGASLSARPFIGFLKSQYTLKIEGYFGYNLPHAFKNDLEIRINLNNANDEIQIMKLMSSNYCVLGGALSYSWTNGQNFGVGIRLGYQSGQYLNKPNVLLLGGIPIAIMMDKMHAPLIQAQIGLHYSLFKQ
jgi:hypothetical protein